MLGEVSPLHPVPNAWRAKDPIVYGGPYLACLRKERIFSIIDISSRTSCHRWTSWTSSTLDWWICEQEIDLLRGSCSRHHDSASIFWLCLVWDILNKGRSETWSRTSYTGKSPGGYIWWPSVGAFALRLYCWEAPHPLSRRWCDLFALGKCPSEALRLLRKWVFHGWCQVSQRVSVVVFRPRDLFKVASGKLWFHAENKL